MAVTFTSEAAKRIKSAVLRVESMPPQSRVGQPAGDGPQEESFWAWIIGADTTGTRYTWVRVFPDFDSDSPDITLDNAMKFRLFGTPPVSGIFSAYEANSRRGITDVFTRLYFAGFRKDDGVPTYLFTHFVFDPNEYPVPLHDHRDNLAGGFAFGAYHPGTKLPQQPSGR